MVVLGRGAVYYERSDPVPPRGGGTFCFLPPNHFRASEGGALRSAVHSFFSSINLQPLKKRSPTNYEPFTLDKGPESPLQTSETVLE